MKNGTDFKPISLRRWQVGDEAALVKYANNMNIWRNVRDSFPYPYTQADAQNWIKLCETETMPTVFAIVHNFEAIGGVGIILGQDVSRKTAEIGYWLAEPFWGQGFAAEAVKQMTDYTFKTFDVHRIFAGIFNHNHASMRAIEKAGYVFETILKQAIFKENQLYDSHIYTKFRE